MQKTKGFPSIKRDSVATRGGNFYMLRNGKWLKAEYYLPGSHTTYGFESMEACAMAFLDRLESGVKQFKHAISASGSTPMDDYTKYIDKWFK